MGRPGGRRWHAGRPERGGQALVEFVLVFPMFALVLFSVIILGLYIF
jgi:Flp pilus assembly protein TadG